MKTTKQRGSETLGEAAARLLRRIEQRKGSERPKGSEEFECGTVSGLLIGSRRTADAGETAMPQDRAGAPRVFRLIIGGKSHAEHGGSGTQEWSGPPARSPVVNW